MKKQLFLVGALGIGVLAYFFWHKKTAGKPAPVTSGKNGQPAQPSQNYPWSIIFPPRVDNQSQPWYNGPSVTPMGNNAAGTTAGTLTAGASVIHSLSDIWGTLTASGSANTSQSNLTPESDPSAGYGAATAGASIGTADSTGSYDDSSLPGQYSDQSNAVGSDLSFQFGSQLGDGGTTVSTDNYSDTGYTDSYELSQVDEG